MASKPKKKPAPRRRALKKTAHKPWPQYETRTHAPRTDSLAVTSGRGVGPDAAAKGPTTSEALDAMRNIVGQNAEAISHLEDRLAMVLLPPGEPGPPENPSSRMEGETEIIFLMRCIYERAIANREWIMRIAARFPI